LGAFAISRQGQGRQRDQLAGAFDPERAGIHLQVADHQGVVVHLAPGPPDQGAHPRLDLAQRRRLDDVIVGAEVEGVELGIQIVLGGQHDNRHRLAKLAPDGLAEADPAAARKRHVEQHQVVGLARHQVPGAAHVARVVSNVALDLQEIAEIARQINIVFDDQNRERHGGFGRGLAG
jgi:hypothetical protein